MNGSRQNWDGMKYCLDRVVCCFMQKKRECEKKGNWKVIGIILIKNRPSPRFFVVALYCYVRLLPQHLIPFGCHPEFPL